MIREITRQQIETKTAQGERVVLVEAQPSESGYEARHIPGALPVPVNGVRHLAMEYLPDHGAEIVVYGKDERSSEVDDVAWQLSMLGYSEIYVYRGGKRDWFGAGEFSESVHEPPEAGTHVQFDDPPAARDSSRGYAALITSAAAVTILYAGYRLIRGLIIERERFRGTDEVSEIPASTPSLKYAFREEDEADLERNAGNFDAASAAE